MGIFFVAQQGCQDDVQGSGPLTRDGQTRALDVDAGRQIGQSGDALPTIGQTRNDGGDADAAAQGTDECELGARRCGANSDIERCEDADGDGVSEWRSAMLCPLDQPCRDGRCQMPEQGPCEDDCTLGATQCAGDLIQDCVRNAEDCLEWTSPVACPGGLQCREDACRCDDECMPGARECTANGYRECIQNADCARWSPSQACPDGQSCVSGDCGQANCNHQCAVVGESECANGQERRCALDANLCRVWTQPQACPNGEMCVGDRCDGPPCEHQCPVLGLNECDGDQQRRCGSDARGCRIWLEPTPCPDGFVCNNGFCSRPPCDHECVAVGQEECVGDLRRRCEFDVGLCRVWGEATPCPGARVCRDRMGCVFDCEDTCDFFGQTRCRDEQMLEQCQPNAMTQCLEWRDFVACGANQVCRDGRCFAR